MQVPVDPLVFLALLFSSLRSLIGKLPDRSRNENFPHRAVTEDNGRQGEYEAAGNRVRLEDPRDVARYIADLHHIHQKRQTKQDANIAPEKRERFSPTAAACAFTTRTRTALLGQPRDTRLSLPGL